MNKDLILATSADGSKITVKKYDEMLSKGDRPGLADFIYDRLYGRYLMPFSFESADKNHKKQYKSGFLMMASCCLLIETYVSFIEIDYRDTNGEARNCFGYFFTTEPRFKEMSIGGLQAGGKLSTKKEGGLPNDFYENVRCGILHNAETRNGWTITRSGKTYFDAATKKIDANRFAKRLEYVLQDYRKKLLSEDFATSAIWNNFRNRMSDLIKNS